MLQGIHWQRYSRTYNSLIFFNPPGLPLFTDVLYFFYPVIHSFHMTSGNTPAASICFKIIDRDVRQAKLEFLPDMVFLVRGMNIMAGTAGPALFPVNMQHMKILLSISEGCNIPRFFSCDYRFFVAQKTEVVFPLFIGGIKTVREGEPENVGVIRAMRIVAGHTVPLNNRAMLKLPFFPHETLSQ